MCRERAPPSRKKIVHVHTGAAVASQLLKRPSAVEYVDRNGPSLSARASLFFGPSAALPARLSRPELGFLLLTFHSSLCLSLSA